jgi:hypothetical protein
VLILLWTKSTGGYMMGYIQINGMKVFIHNMKDVEGMAEV